MAPGMQETECFVLLGFPLKYSRVGNQRGSRIGNQCAAVTRSQAGDDMFDRRRFIEFVITDQLFFDVVVIEQFDRTARVFAKNKIDGLKNFDRTVRDIIRFPIGVATMYNVPD